MKIYLLNKETKEIVQEFENIISWGENFVEFMVNGKYHAKTYCEENKIFTAELPQP